MFACLFVLNVFIVFACHCLFICWLVGWWVCVGLCLLVFAGLDLCACVFVVVCLSVFVCFCLLDFDVFVVVVVGLCLFVYVVGVSFFSVSLFLQFFEPGPCA